jgi:hypothetical protein
MSARRTLVIGLVIGLALAVMVPVVSAQDTVTAPTVIGQSASVTWTGTTLPGANSGSDCSGTALGADSHSVEIVVPTGAYTQVSIVATASITYSGPVDMIVTIVRPDGSTVSGDDGFVDTDESVALGNPAAGVYRVIACPFLGAVPQAYTGSLTLTAGPPAAPSAASCRAPGKPIVFSQPAYVDTSRAGGEPSVVAHPDGTLLYAAHAGTTHFYSLEVDDPDSEAFFEQYRGQVHAWYSSDNGASWHFVDRSLPPENLPNSGFSDPDFAIDAAGNVYLSEINLVNVAVSKSTTSGKSYGLQNFFAEDITDRQWSAAGPANVLFLDGNPSEGGTFPNDPVGHGDHTIYRSLDGGKTFSNGVSDPGGLGDIVYDPVRSTLFEANYDGSTLAIGAFRQALTADFTTALTPEISPIETGVSMLSHWPAIDVDAKGNLYIVWDESGNGSRPAGIWSSYSTDGGQTWAKSFRVDPDDRTDIWPWIAVGDQGRVAIAWFGNDHALPSDDAEAAGPADPWNVYVAQTTSGLGCSESPVPGYKVSKATPVPFHVGTICMGGTTCQAMLIDRRLGDYFTIDIDTTGSVVLAYSDTRQGGAVSLPAFQRQTGGTLFAKVPKKR